MANIDYDDVLTSTLTSRTGKLADKHCKTKETGYYTEDNMPSKCKSHAGFTEDNTKPTKPENENEDFNTEPTMNIEISISTEPTEPLTTEPSEAVVNNTIHAN